MGKKRLKLEGGESAAAKFMSVASDDLLLEILLRLPDSRSVIRCGSVSKRWSSLVSPTKYLIRKFNLNKTKINSQLPYTLLIRGRYMSARRTPPYEYEYRKPTQQFFSKRSKLLHPVSTSTTAYLDFLGLSHYYIASSSHDLLLIQSSRHHFHVCNPLTRQSVPLPEAPRCGNKDKIFRCGLVCEPNCNCNSCCNCSGIKYKVVLLNADGERDAVCHAAIFSSESGQWSVSTFRFYLAVCLYLWHVTCVTISRILYFPYGDGCFRGIVAFDVSDFDSCRLISLPKDFGRGWQASDVRARVGLVRGRLRLSQFFWNKKTDLFVLKAWQLNDDTSSSWDLVHRVSLRRIHESFYLTLLALHPEDGDVFFFRRDYRYNSDICRYKVGSNNYQHVCDYPIRDSLCAFTLVHPWWPTKIPALLPSNSSS